MPLSAPRREFGSAVPVSTTDSETWIDAIESILDGMGTHLEKDSVDGSSPRKWIIARSVANPNRKWVFYAAEASAPTHLAAGESGTAGQLHMAYVPDTGGVATIDPTANPMVTGGSSLQNRTSGFIKTWSQRGAQTNLIQIAGGDTDLWLIPNHNDVSGSAQTCFIWAGECLDPGSGPAEASGGVHCWGTRVNGTDGSTVNWLESSANEHWVSNPSGFSPGTTTVRTMQRSANFLLHSQSARQANDAVNMDSMSYYWTSGIDSTRVGTMRGVYPYQDMATGNTPINNGVTTKGRVYTNSQSVTANGLFIGDNV